LGQSPTLVHLVP